MLDIQFIRDHAEAVKQATEDKQFDPKVVDKLLAADTVRRDLIKQVESLRAARNELNEELKVARTDELISKSRELKDKLQDLEPKLKESEEEYNQLILQIPNPSADDVKVGKEEDNEVLRNFGPTLDVDSIG